MTPKDHPRRRRGYRSQAAKDRAELRELRERVRVVPESPDRQVKNPIALSAVDVSKLKRHASRKQYGLQVRGKSVKESRHGDRGGTESDPHPDAERNTRMCIRNASGCGTREADALAKTDAHPDADKGRGCASDDPGEPVQASFKFIAGAK